MLRPCLWTCLVLALPIPAAVAQGEEKALAGAVQELVRHTQADRRAWLRAALVEAGCSPRIQEYVPERGRPGKNLVVTFGEGAPLTVLSANYDHLRVSPGANDDASGCVVLLELARELARKPPARRVVIGFVDQGAAGADGVVGLLASFGREPVLAGLHLRAVGIGDHVIHGPRDALPGHAGARVLTAALAAAGVPATALDRMPPGPGRGFRACGVDGLTLTMAPAGEVAPLRTWLGWKRRPGRRRPPKPPFLARLRTPRDGPAGISGPALRRALSVARAFVRAAASDRGRGRIARPGILARCRELRDVVRTGGVELAAPKGAHVELLQAVGPRAAFGTFISVVEKDREGLAAESLRTLLGTVTVGAALRRDVEAVFGEEGPPDLADGLRKLWGKHGARMVWDADVPGFRLEEPEKNVK